MNSQTITPDKPTSSSSAKPSENRRNTKPQSGARTETPKSSNQSREVSFELDASAAKEVLLAGDFTEWEKTPIKLRKSNRGTWQTSLTLAPGQYNYRFVVDGQWRNDPRAQSTRPNPFGSTDSVLEII